MMFILGVLTLQAMALLATHLKINKHAKEIIEDPECVLEPVNIAHAKAVPMARVVHSFVSDTEALLYFGDSAQRHFFA